jgi:serine/threonine-protein kinase
LRHQLLREARAASQLQHQHIVTVYDVTELNEHICLVMEYLEGQTLAVLLQEEPRLPLKQVIALVEQAAGALDYAHTQKVIHRDIKPANLIITTAGVKITDFSIAKKMDDPQSLHSTGLKGTVIYMSPEQVSQVHLDGRSDLFSLATVAFEKLAAALPWPGASYFDLMNNIINDSPLSLADFGVPSANVLEPVFRKALAKEPDERYQQGNDFVDELKKVATSTH